MGEYTKIYVNVTWKIHVILYAENTGVLHGEKSAKLAHLTLFKFFIERGRQFFLCNKFYNFEIR
jgi:hypothetical protein